MIRWKATSVNGLVEYEQEAESFKELFDALDGRGIISDPDFPLYDTALLEKYGKSFDDAGFKDESGELDYEKVGCEFPKVVILKRDSVLFQFVDRVTVLCCFPCKTHSRLSHI